MVPGSTLRYGSHFCRVTWTPRLSRRQPIEEAATPFPSEETTPPVTKIYFGAIRAARKLTHRAFLTSTGVTYKQLWIRRPDVSNQRTDMARFILFIGLYRRSADALRHRCANSAQAIFVDGHADSSVHADFFQSRDFAAGFDSAGSNHGTRRCGAKLAKPL
jgi:hypothetical protein